MEIERETRAQFSNQPTKTRPFWDNQGKLNADEVLAAFRKMLLIMLTVIKLLR